jgi:hypothetical protein
MSHKSIWSGKISESLVQVSASFNSQEENVFVEPEHKERLIAYLGFADKWKNVFLASVLSLSAGMAILALVAPSWAVGACLVLLAIILMVLPLPTPQTIQLFGVQKSILLVRVIAVLIAVFGVWIVFR